MAEIESPLAGHVYDKPELLEATKHWKKVTELVEGCYEWAEMRVYFDPHSRRYYWYSDSGCSCFYWDPSTVGDFSDGDRNAVKTALRGFAEENSWAFTSPGVLVDALDGLAKFKEVY